MSYCAVGQHEPWRQHVDAAGCQQMGKTLPSPGAIWAEGDGCYVPRTPDPILAAAFPTLCLAQRGHWDPEKNACYFPAYEPGHPVSPPTMGPYLDEAGCAAMATELPSSGAQWVPGKGCYIAPPSGFLAAAFPTLCLTRQGIWDEDEKTCHFPPSPSSSGSASWFPIAAGAAVLGLWLLARRDR